MSTNGSRPEENQFILDGLTNDNPLQGLTIINGPGVAGDAATIMPIDAIQEVKIEENPKAEYGGKPGAVVNVGIKSGHKQYSWHGLRFRPRQRDGRAQLLQRHVSAQTGRGP